MINLIFIHGISSQTTGYSDGLFDLIVHYYRRLLKKKGLLGQEIDSKVAQLVQREILWSDITTDLTNRYLELEYELHGKKKGFWNWITKKIDPLALQIMYYIKDKGDKDSGVMNILEKVDNRFKEISKESKDMVIIAHSLGSVIAFDYIFCFRKYCSDMSYNISSFITLGSPLPIFTSAMGHVNSDIELPKNIKSWYNLFDNEDAIAKRCKPFFPKIPIQDVEVRTGLFPLSAHAKYWKSRHTASAIAKILIDEIPL